MVSFKTFMEILKEEGAPILLKSPIRFQEKKAFQRATKKYAEQFIDEAIVACGPQHKEQTAWAIQDRIKQIKTQIK